jgi:hypothetical protein
MAFTRLAIWSSIWAIWACTSVSAGGARTTKFTPRPLAASRAPRSTAAQKGLPEPGPFMLRRIV